MIQLSLQTSDRRLSIGEALIEARVVSPAGKANCSRASSDPFHSLSLFRINRRLLGECGNFGPQGSRLLRKVALAACLTDGIGQRGRIARRRQLRQLIGTSARRVDRRRWRRA